MHTNWLRRVFVRILSSSTFRGWAAAPSCPVFSSPTSEPERTPDAPCGIPDSPLGNDADVTDAWLALEEATGANLMRAEAHDALFLEAKWQMQFGPELSALCAMRRAYLTLLSDVSTSSASFQTDDEKEVQS